MRDIAISDMKHGNRPHMKHSIAALLIAIGLSACASMNVPDIGNELAAFKDTRIDGDYPDADDVPVAPTDIRSANDWDQAAEELIAMREAFDIPGGPVDAMSQAEIEAEFERLSQEVHAYKADDPVGGIE